MAEHVPLVEQAALQVLSCGRLVVDCDTSVYKFRVHCIF